ncbi:hypothetical protein FB567DRAFT_578494 [Paraphoma chrysanthemicola]|uniref:WSC domain-containing protein n=1 Tax=Paraphoma chrysanthemicola TaxID=798071 RepID=A0A8K0W1K9_9PLEO|nr:hypothetical protein FB567DRAFT_578494 [Paraphoma chrysanthemicola]
MCDAAGTTSYAGLPNGISTNSIVELTQSKCYDYCRTKIAPSTNKPYTNIAIENGNICSCTSNFNFNPPIDADPTSCNKGTAGDDTQRGGGLDFIDLWEIKSSSTSNPDITTPQSKPQQDTTERSLTTTHTTCGYKSPSDQQYNTDSASLGQSGTIREDSGIRI